MALQVARSGLPRSANTRSNYYTVAVVVMRTLYRTLKIAFRSRTIIVGPR